MRSCYILNATAVGFADARATCQALGGNSDLVEFTTGDRAAANVAHHLA